MRRAFLILVALLANLLWSNVNVEAATLELNPSQDTMLYQFPFAGPGTPSMKSLYPSTLATGFTGTGHDLASLLQFDTASTGLTAIQVTSATLKLYVIPASTLPPPALGADSDATHQIQVNVTKLDAPVWVEAAVKWSTAPPTIGSVIGSQTVSGVSQWISIDVTSLVQDWLTTPGANNGLRLSQLGPRVNNSEGTATIALFDSTNGGEFEPLLEITAVESVPEPSTLALAGAAAFAACLVAIKWRRK